MPEYRMRVILTETLIAERIVRVTADTPEAAAHTVRLQVDRVDGEGWIDLRTLDPYVGDSLAPAEQEHVMTRLEAKEIADSYLMFTLLDDAGRDLREIDPDGEDDA